MCVCQVVAILGTGCPKCRQTAELVRQAVDGQVKISGKVLKVRLIAAFAGIVGAGIPIAGYPFNALL